MRFRRDVSNLPAIFKLPFLQQCQVSIKFTGSLCWVHNEIFYPKALVSSQASDQTWMLSPLLIFTAPGEMASPGRGSFHPKVKACCVFTSTSLEYFRRVWQLIFEVGWGSSSSAPSEASPCWRPRKKIPQFVGYFQNPQASCLHAFEAREPHTMPDLSRRAWL